MLSQRRSDYDVTNTVQVSSPEAVHDAVIGLFSDIYPDSSLDYVDQAFTDFRLLFTGKAPGYLGCDTVYHDIQHTLDMTLALARLIAGHEKSQKPNAKLGLHRATFGIITALFHDAGYIRREDDNEHKNGAEFTRFHVTRSANFLSNYLPTIGLPQAAEIAARIVHFTGFEIKFDDIVVENPLDRKVGYLVGTADLIAQMADRCYLEKCRDRLYHEFVLGDVAVQQDTDGSQHVKYKSGLDLLRQTPAFFEGIRAERLDGEFGGAYHYIEVLYDGNNPYLDAIDRNLQYLKSALNTGSWPVLRREPPCFAWEHEPVENIQRLSKEHLDKLKLAS